MSDKQKYLEAFERLLVVMDELREQCPWDKKQTMESLRHLTIEEVYELGDAILDKDLEDVKKELGDVLLHIVFYSKIASETNDFDIADRYFYFQSASFGCNSHSCALVAYCNYFLG